MEVWGSVFPAYGSSLRLLGLGKLALLGGLGGLGFRIVGFRVSRLGLGARDLASSKTWQ